MTMDFDFLSIFWSIQLVFEYGVFVYFTKTKIRCLDVMKGCFQVVTKFENF